MNSEQQPTLTAPMSRRRFVFVVVALLGWTGVIAGRLVWEQVVRHSDWVRTAARQQQRTFEVAPRRGVLYDRNLRELAVTVLADSVYAVPSELGENREDVAQMLASVVHAEGDNFTNRNAILARFNASRNFAWVARKLDPETAQRVRELNLKGVYVQKEFKRFYPNGDLSAQVLGYVGLDDNGLGGMERMFDADLHGAPGRVLTAVDAKRHALGSEEREPEPGENLVLTIDANIQYMAERALDRQMQKTKAKHGVVVVQDPHTGQILALAVAPRFNPNDLRHQDPETLTNRAVSDVYEPGSTFKLVTYSAAMDAAGVQPTDLVDCQGGAITLYGRTIHDDISDRGMGVVTVQKALERSSDVAAVKMALKLGNDKFYQYIKAYGFGDRSNIELPSETRGLLQKPRDWGATSIGSISIGQEVAVTPVQLVTMVSAIANGGVYLPPHILMSETEKTNADPSLKPAGFHPANQLPSTLPEGAHRVISEMTSAKMRRMMEGIVTEGTGGGAALNGYSAGGKTGTAQKIDVKTHTYSKTQHVASFAGMAPVSNPAITVAVVIDDPGAGSYYGAAVSAPVFQEVAQEVLEYLGVPHDQPLQPKKASTQAAQKLVAEDSGGNEPADLNKMFAQVNALPGDDPLRKGEDASAAMAQAAPAQPVKNETGSGGMFARLPEKLVAAFKARSGFASDESAGPMVKKLPPPHDDGVRVSAERKVAVPEMTGASLRIVIERARQSGLRVQAVGDGLAAEQVPAAGVMVPEGTEVIVRFAR